MNTPLIRLTDLEKKLKISNQLWAKCEFQNVTGSFKDRGSKAEINQALTLKKKGVVCASTGNMAASLASLAAKNNLKCLVFIPQDTPQAKLAQATICGAKLIKIKGNYDLCVKKAEKYAKQNNYLLCGDYRLRRLGQTTVGIELAQSEIDFQAFFVPVGNGTLGCAISEGLAMFGKFPQFIGVQGKGADPIVKAFNANNSIEPVNSPTTIASAMNVGDPLDGQLTLDWIKQTKGQIISVTDKQIKTAQKLLAITEGLYVETASAATLAGLIKLKTNIKTLSNIVLILTGAGLKERR